MIMEIGPILSTLKRHKITASLVVLEIALSCAIVCNAVFLVTQRIERMQMSSGVAEHELVQVQAASIGSREDSRARVQEDLAALRRIPGVVAATLVNQIPFGNSSWNTGIKLDPKQNKNTLVTTSYYGEDIAQTFGAKLVAGRYFTADEYVNLDDVMRDPDMDFPHIVVITRALGEKLWPGEDALGKTFYSDEDPLRVVGVVDELVRPSLSNGDETAQWSVLYPARMTMGFGASYVLRSAPEQRRHVIDAAVAALKANDPKRVVLEKRTFDEVRAEFFQGDRTMAGLLVGVCVALLIVTALGIVGLGSFWVAQRRRQIGVRRALGATRSNILHYFQTENFLLATIGIALGMLLAWTINLFLMHHYELPRLPWQYLPVGALCLWLIGQAAVLGPALRAAAVPPVVATRSV
jgi:putative ABC transport system permease protein